MMNTEGTGIRLVALLCRIGLCAMFVYAGALKLSDPNGFAEDLMNYRLLPEALVAPLALVLPVLEIVTAVALLLPSYARGGALLCALMLAVFAAAMAQAKMRGIDLECGCFGQAESTQVSWSKVAQNLALAMLALWLTRTARSAPTTSTAVPSV